MPLCSDIRIEKHNVFIDENSKLIESFTVNNFSNERFFVTGMNAFELPNSFVSVKEFDFQQSIGPYSSGSVEVEIESFSVDSLKSEEAIIQLEGYFLGGKNCYFEDIEKSFTVYVLDVEEEASCNDIQLSTFNVEVPENTSKIIVFSIKNNSNKNFYVDSVRFSQSVFNYFNAVIEDFDSFIESNGVGEIIVKINSESVSFDESEELLLQVKGMFANDSLNCSFNEISKSFEVKILNQDSESLCDEIIIHERDFHVEENRVSHEAFNIENRSSLDFTVLDVEAFDNSAFFDLREEQFSPLIRANDEGFIELRIESESVSTDSSGIGFVKLKGKFEDETYCSFSDIGTKSFTVFVDDIDNDNEQLCNNLTIETFTVRLNSGETVIKSFKLKNDSPQNFVVDFVDAWDYSGFFQVSEQNWDSIVESNDSGKINVKIKAHSTEQNKSGTAFLKLRGHFTNGIVCTSSEIGTKSFEVKVKGSLSDSETSACSAFELIVPETKTVLGEELFNILIDNPSNKTGIIFLNGENLSIEPQTILIPAFEEFSSTIKVKLLNNLQGILNYEVQLSGCPVLLKQTRILSSPQKLIDITSFPLKKVISETGSISIVVKNNSSKTQTVRIAIEGLPSTWAVDEKILSLNPGESKTVSLNIKTKGFGVFNAEIVAESQGFQVRKQISFNVRIPEELINIDAVIESPVNGNTYTLKALIENNANERISGRIELNVPSEWKIEGPKTIELNANESNEFVFKVTPLNELTKEVLSSLTLTLESGQEITVLLTFKPKPLSIGAALASLESGWVNIGLIIVVLILIALLFYQRKK
jgi:hypothetical protein